MRPAHTAGTEIQIAPDTLNLAYMERDLPIRGEVDGDDAYIFGPEEKNLAMTARPVALANVPSAYAVYAHGESMRPRYRPGELLYVDPIRPAAPGDDVVIHFVDGTGCIRELVRRTAKTVTVRQHNPSKETELPAERVIAVHLIIASTRVRI